MLPDTTEEQADYPFIGSSGSRSVEPGQQERLRTLVQLGPGPLRHRLRRRGVLRAVDPDVFQKAQSSRRCSKESAPVHQKVSAREKLIADKAEL